MINSPKLDPIKALVWVAIINGGYIWSQRSSTKALDHHEHAARHDKEAAKRTCAVLFEADTHKERTDFVHLPLRTNSVQWRLRYDRLQL
jgi:hypothetical protein